jgi:hypothetical protein
MFNFASQVHFGIIQKLHCFLEVPLLHGRMDYCSSSVKILYNISFVALDMKNFACIIVKLRQTDYVKRISIITHRSRIIIADLNITIHHFALTQ